MAGDDSAPQYTEYAYDEDFVPLLGALPRIGDYETAERIRAQRAERADALEPVPRRPGITIEDHTIPGPDGAPDVVVRVYRPRDAAAAPEATGAAETSARAGFLEIHGGGFLFGTLDMMDGWCQMVAERVDCVVVSVDYRLAPEHPYPAGLLDCHAALQWMHDQADTLGIDRARIAIGGQSAGGGLAAGLALYARDRGGPEVCYHLLEIPEIDDRLDTPSMRAFVDTPFWNRPNASWSWKHYLGDDHRDDPPIYAAPARATVDDLQGLPPAYVSTMEFDPLRDEGIRYAAAMLEAGISVELHSYAGTFHGSAFFPEAEPTRRNNDEIVAILSRRLARRG